MRVVVAGLGRMGRPIAERLRDAGHVVVAIDPRAEASSGFEASGAAEVLVTVLPGDAELRAFDAPPHDLWIDVTSADPETVAAIPGRFVGAPMLGGPADAAQGTLRFLAAGAAADVAIARDLLAPAGEVVDVGDDRTHGYVVKLLANALWFAHSVAATEALLVGRAAGIPVSTLRDLLVATPGSSRYLEEHAPRLLAGDLMADFGIDRVVEELDAVERLRGPGGSSVLGASAALHREALERFGAVDGELLASALLEERAGRPLSDPSVVE